MQAFIGAVMFGLPDGKRRFRCAVTACVLAFIVILTATGAFSQEQKTLRGVALVIGQSDYEHLAPLPNPENDADAIETLLSDLGFDSVRRTDRDAATLARDLERFAQDAEDADVAVLYYSGHGIEAGGENFLIPVDADLTALDAADQKLVPVSAFIDRLKATVPVVIVMLDACRDNPFPPGSPLRLSGNAQPMPVGAGGLGLSRGATSLKAAEATAAPADANVGTVIAFAAEPGKVALDGDAGANSPYAAAVLRHFDAMAGEEFGMVMRMVAEEVYLKTGGAQRPWINESLRRQLYFGEAPDQPTGAEGDILKERRGLLVTIAALPDRERRTIEAVASDTGVPMDALYGMLKALGAEVPDDPGQLDALLRGQTEKVKAMIAERNTLKSTDPEIVRLSSLADQALAEGALTTAISLRQQAKTRAKEVEATVEDAETELRQRRVELAEVYAKSAEAYALAFKHREAGHDYEEASRQVDRWDEEQAFWYVRSASTAYLEAGKFRGGQADLERSADTGRRAAEMVERLLADHPDDRQYWEDISAQTLNNLANATNALYSATKRRDVLAQSIDAYERALKVLNRDRVEQDWVVVQHNLAGALMMLSEADNDDATLERAIDAYKASLTVWTREANPQKWALASANLGNALSALGKRQQNRATLRQAIASLDAALEIQTFENEPLDWAWTQREMADSYAELAALTRDDADLRKSVAASQAALRVYTLDRAPRSWAQTMHNMAFAYQTSATAETNAEALAKATAIYEQIVAAVSADEQPGEYALTMGNLGNARIEQGKLEKDDALVAAGIERLWEVAALYERLQRPLDTASILSDVGNGLVTLGNLRSSAAEPEQAIALYSQAMDLYRQNGETRQADSLRGSIAFAAVELGYQRSKAGDHAGAVAAYRASMDHRDRATDLQNWLFSVKQTAIALHNQGVSEEGVETLRQAADTYRLALSATSADADRAGWTEAQENLIGVLRTIGERTRAVPDQIALADAYDAVIALKDTVRDRDGRDLAAADRAWALSLAGEYGNDPKLLEQAAEAYRQALKPGDMRAQDKVFHVLNRMRTLFLLANLGGGDPPRREALAAIDDNWSLIERAGSAEQKVNALTDRANLMYAIVSGDAGAYTAGQMLDAFRRAGAAADRATQPELWRSAQRMVAYYELAGADSPDFPVARMQSGLGTLRALLDATPRQAEPAAWAETANWYGYALGLQGKRENRTASFEEAVPVLREALAAYLSVDDPVAAAHTRDSLCSALVGLGQLQKKQDLVREGAEHCDLAVAAMRERKMSDVLAIAEANQAEAHRALAGLSAWP